MFDDPIIKLPTQSLRRFASVVRKKDGWIGKAFKTWGRMFAAFIRGRFIKFSRGGGNWRRLAASTLRRRRNKRSASILIDTGLLVASLSPEVVQLRNTADGLFVRFGGTSAYPDGTTVTDVLTWHNKGGGNLPRRQILVAPDAATQREMRIVMDRAVKRDFDAS